MIPEVRKEVGTICCRSTTISPNWAIGATTFFSLLFYRLHDPEHRPGVVYRLYRHQGTSAGEEEVYALAPFWTAGGQHAPLVSIIVPAYNEEINAVSSVQSLLNGDYPNFEIIFVNDGSRDQTYERVRRGIYKAIPGSKSLPPNGGKASALNYGIGMSEAEFVICIDADTKLLPGAVSLMMEHFGGERNGHRAGRGKMSVAGECEGRQPIESAHPLAGYRISAVKILTGRHCYLNAITVVPGAIGAFGKRPSRMPAVLLQTRLRKTAISRSVSCVAGM